MKGSIILIILLVTACTSKPAQRLPGPNTMHFPAQMALKGSTLAVASTSPDGKYHLARLISIDTVELKKNLDSKTAPIISSNRLIDTDSGSFYVSADYLLFASRASNTLFGVPFDDNNNLLCDNADSELSFCQDALSLKLDTQALDPFSIIGLKDNNILIAYLSSDRLDLIEFNKTPKNMRAIKSIYAYDILKNKLKKMPPRQRVFTRQLRTYKNKIYVLLERHSEKDIALAKPTGSYLLVMDTDLIDTAELIDLQEWSIKGVQDFFIDENKNILYLLASKPSALYKIELATKAIIETHGLCMGATSLAPSWSQDKVFVPCFLEDKVISLSLSTLKVENIADRAGRGPVFIVVDEKNQLIYCTFYKDGTLLVFDYELRLQGQVFDKAPDNRIGS